MSETARVIMGICTSASVCGILSILAPSKSTGKCIKTALTLLMLMSVCAVLRDAENLAMPAISVQSVMEEYENTADIIIDNVREAVRRECENVLDKYGIEHSCIEVETQVSDNEITVKSIEIYIKNDSEVQVAADEISDKTGAIPQFFYETRAAD